MNSYRFSLSKALACKVLDSPRMLNLPGYPRQIYADQDDWANSAFMQVVGTRCLDIQIAIQKEANTCWSVCGGYTHGAVYGGTCSFNREGLYYE